MSAAAAPVQEVRVCIRAESFDSRGKPVFEVYSDSDSYTALGIECVGEEGEMAAGPAKDSALETAAEKEEYCYEIELTSETEEGFGILKEEEIHISGVKAVCRQAVRTDKGQTLRLTVVLTEPGEIIGEVPGIFLEGGVARWEPAPGASAYYVNLYRNGKRLRDGHRTEGLFFDFSSLFKEAGNYSCRIFPLTERGKKGKAAESPQISVDVSKAAQIQEQWNLTLTEKLNGSLSSPGWIQTTHGWYYVNRDGTLPVNTCLLLDGVPYYFDAEGRWEEEEGSTGS